MRSYTFNSLVFSSLVFTLTFHLSIGLLLSYWISPANAHGALVEVTQAAIGIKATFDNGEPMADAQVLIYAPTDLETPAITGETDEAGLFSFVPDTDVEGPWEVTVRQAGHGGTATFAVGERGDLRSGSTAVESQVQQWITIAAVIWGFIGTAFFFSAKASGGKV